MCSPGIREPWIPYIEKETKTNPNRRHQQRDKNEYPFGRGFTAEFIFDCMGQIKSTMTFRRCGGARPRFGKSFSYFARPTCSRGFDAKGLCHRIPNNWAHPVDDIHLSANFLAARESCADTNESADGRQDGQDRKRNPHG